MCAFYHRFSSGSDIASAVRFSGVFFSLGTYGKEDARRKMLEAIRFQTATMSASESATSRFRSRLRLHSSFVEHRLCNVYSARSIKDKLKRDFRPKQDKTQINEQ